MALNFRYLVAQVNTTNMMKNRLIDRLAVKERKNKHQKYTCGDHGEEHQIEKIDMLNVHRNMLNMLI